MPSLTRCPHRASTLSRSSDASLQEPQHPCDEQGGILDIGAGCMGRDTNGDGERAGPQYGGTALGLRDRTRRLGLSSEV